MKQTESKTNQPNRTEVDQISQTVLNWNQSKPIQLNQTLKI
jgi:hypothetical protein